MPASLVVSPAPASPLAALGTFLLGWLLMAITAHVAASYILPDPPLSRAIAVGAAPAAVSMALIRLPPAAIVAAGITVDALAFHLAYRESHRTTAIMVLLHYAVTVLVVLLLANVAALLSTAPG